MVAFAGQLNGCGCLVQAESLAAVKLKEVYGLAHVGVGLGPVLAHFERQPGAELEATFANEGSGAEEQRCAFLDRRTAPRGKGSLCELHRGFDVLHAGALVDADDLSRMRRVHGEDFADSLQPCAADDDVVLAAKLVAKFF